jgi:hypothetical protein
VGYDSSTSRTAGRLNGVAMQKGKIGWSLRAVSAFVAVALASSGGALALDNAMKFGKPEVDGLRASAGDVSRDGEIISIHYTLRWTDRRNGWRLNPEAPVNISFWQSNVEPGDLISIEIGYVSLPNAFLARAVDMAEATFRIRAPAGAGAVSLALGRSGLETERVAVPQQ